jgi:ribosomal protein S18 acetylase RimI-like enzyme
MITLVPMTAPDFASFLDASVVAYAKDKVASGQWQESASLALAQAGFNELLPQGLATPNHHLFVLCDSAVPASVGALWFAVQERAAQQLAYVYDIFIVAEQRQKGYATQAFAALEREVRQRGLAGIALHVFGHNKAAQALYNKLGFITTNINMFKPIGNVDA